MEKRIIEVTRNFVSPEERTRLLRLCLAITGDVDAVEDLVQETLLEAWRHEHILRDATRRRQWLSGIARNVCLRWLRKRRRDAAHLIELHANREDQDVPPAHLEDSLADEFDVEVELERKELVELLDRAMALLPVETRIVLIKRYVEESPLAEVAAQLGTNVSAVAMRLQRGKLALRRLLTNELREEIAPYGIQASPTEEWEKTPLWCHLCGQHRLLGRRVPSEGTLLLKCPACSPEAEDVLSRNHLSALKEVKGYRPLLSRLRAWCDRYYRAGLRNGSILCEECRHVLPVRICWPEEVPTWVRSAEETPKGLWRPDERIVIILCENCSSSYRISLEGLVLCLPEGRQFLQAHPRVRTLPQQQIEADGHTAIVTRFESVTDNASLTVVSAYDTYEVLRIDGGDQ